MTAIATRKNETIYDLLKAYFFFIILGRKSKRGPCLLLAPTETICTNRRNGGADSGRGIGRVLPPASSGKPDRCPGQPTEPTDPEQGLFGQKRASHQGGARPGRGSSAAKLGRLPGPTGGHRVLAGSNESPPRPHSVPQAVRRPGRDDWRRAASSGRKRMDLRAVGTVRIVLCLVQSHR